MAYVPAQNVTNNIAFLMEEMNMPYEFAVGYTANKMAESGNLLDPFARNPNGGAYGISQWLDGRQDNLNAFRKTLPANTPEFIVQQKFFQQELTPNSPYADTLSIKRHNELLNRYYASQGMTMPDIVQGLEKAFFRSRPRGYESELTPEEEEAFFNSMGQRMKFAELLTGKNLGAGYYKMMKNRNIDPMDLMNYVNAPRKTLMGSLSDLFSDNQGKQDRSLDRAGLFNDLALAFNSMRLKPDQNLAMGLVEQRKTDAELGLFRDNNNKTVDYLRRTGRADLMPLVGTMDADDLIELAQTNPNEYSKEQQQSIMALSKQAYDVLESYKERRDAYKTIMLGFEQGGGISDFTLVTQYAKILDPRSAVTDGEASAIAGAGGVTRQVIQDIAQNVAIGKADPSKRNIGFLPPSVRRDIANLTIKAYKSASEEAVNLLEGFYEQGRAFGVKAGDESFIYRNTNPQGTDWRSAWTNVEGMDPTFRLTPFIDINAEYPEAPEKFIEKSTTGENAVTVERAKQMWTELSVADKRAILRSLGLPN